MDRTTVKVKCIYSETDSIKYGKIYRVAINDENELLIFDEMGYLFVIGEVINNDISLASYHDVDFKIVEIGNEILSYD